MKRVLLILFFCVCGAAPGIAQKQVSPKQLANWLKRFPEADANRDGELTVEEANAYRNKLKTGRNQANGGRGAPRQFKVDPGWEADRFPEDAVCYKSPEEIKAIYCEIENKQITFPSREKTGDAIRIVGTGHSFMAPGYRTLPVICRAADSQLYLYTHTGGGITGSTRYKWEQENGIFQFDDRPTPKLLCAISNSSWDKMMWGPYFNDKPAYYSCWIDFCLKYNPEMTFYLSDAWLQLFQLDETPESEDVFTEELVRKMGDEKRELYIQLVESLNETYPGKVYILPTCDAMTLAALKYIKGELPGIEGFNRVIGRKERSLWKDHLGHLGPGFERLEGYVFYATLYRRSPELIEKTIEFSGHKNEFPSEKLDQIFRKLAWQAVTNHHLSGVKDENGDGIGD